ncbi:MAG: twin-arginine translocation signal domain-containing protein [Pseudomonadota bacterium]
MSINSPSRRHFLRQAGSAVAVGALAPTLSAYAARRGQGVNRTPTSPYGDLAPVLDQTTGLPLLKLPEGFSYAS